MRLPPVRAVTFDAGGTLIEPFPSVGQIYGEMAAEFGFHCKTADELNESFFRAWKNRQTFDYSRSHWEKLVEQTFDGPLPAGLFDAIYGRFKEASAWRVYDDVEETVTQLRQRGYKLAVISNWDERLLNLLEVLGIAKYLDHIVLSIQVGATKPSKPIFERALRLLGATPVEALHIGDSLSEDVAGAHACGMHSLLLDRTGNSAGAITSLRELLTLVKG